MQLMATDVRTGVPLPLGTHACEGGVNFALFSRHASGVRLELFAQPEDATPTRVIIVRQPRATGRVSTFVDSIKVVSGQ